MRGFFPLVPEQLLAHNFVEETRVTASSFFQVILFCDYLILDRFIQPVVKELNFLLH